MAGGRDSRRRGRNCSASHIDKSNADNTQADNSHAADPHVNEATIDEDEASSSEFFPISTPTWSEMKEEYLKLAWDEIQKRFTTDHPNAKKKIMTIMNSRWRDWKSYLKSDNFVPCDRPKSIQNTSGNDRVKPSQWAALVDYWLSEDAKKISTQNRENRNKLLVGHTLGTKSIPKKKYEVLQFQKDKRELDRADMYIASHTRTDNSILPGANSNVQKIIELKKAAGSNTGNNNSTQSTEREDILAQVLGPERHGRLRHGGIGATATNTWGPRNTNEDLQRENRELKDELKVVRVQGDATARKVDELQSIIREMLKGNIPIPSGHSSNQDRSTNGDNGENGENNGSNNLEDL